MPEPTSTTSVAIVTFAVALLGPMAGEYAVIVLSALAGSLWALSKLETATRVAGAALVLRLVLTAVALTGFVAWFLETEYQWPAHHLLAPVAFVIGALGDRWPRIFDAVFQRVRRRIAGEPAKAPGEES